MKFLHQLDHLKIKVNQALAKSNRSFIVLFIISYFTFVIFWLWLNLPAPLRMPEPIHATLNAKLWPIGTLVGIEQNWTLFSPTVKKCNSYNLLVVAFQNGLLKLYELPRMEKLNIGEKWQHEKFRKLFIDNFPNPKHAFIHAAISRFLVRANYQPENPPARLSYFLISYLIPDPELNKTTQRKNKGDIKATVENYFVYGVSPEDFN